MHSRPLFPMQCLNFTLVISGSMMLEVGVCENHLCFDTMFPGVGTTALRDYTKFTALLKEA